MISKKERAVRSLLITVLYTLFFLFVASHFMLVYSFLQNRLSKAIIKKSLTVPNLPKIYPVKPEYLKMLYRTRKVLGRQIKELIG